MALDQITSQAIADGAISAGDLADGSITHSKLHTTAIQDKLGYTPVSPTQLTTEINNLISGAPGALNTLDELAAALGDDANFATTVTNALATKANQSSTYTKTEVDTALSAKANSASLGTLAGLNSVGTSNLNDGIVTSAKLASTGRMTIATAARTSQHSLGGDSGWVDHLSVTFTVGVASRIMMIFCESVTYESGAVQGFGRFLVDGSKVGYNFCLGRQAASNQGAAGSSVWHADVSAGSHTIMVQIRNSVGGTTWITPYWSVDEQSVNTLAVMYYA